jgi:AbrB family looped-hinge helix DNA binding protein
MKTLTVTAKGQVTLRKDLLRHLGVKPGQRIEIRELPGGRIEVRAAKPAGTIDGFLGALAGKSAKRLRVDEIDEIAARGWADQA